MYLRYRFSGSSIVFRFHHGTNTGISSSPPLPICRRTSSSSNSIPITANASFHADACSQLLWTKVPSMSHSAAFTIAPPPPQTLEAFDENRAPIARVPHPSQPLLRSVGRKLFTLPTGTPPPRHPHPSPGPPAATSPHPVRPPHPSSPSPCDTARKYARPASPADPHTTTPARQ